ncbi:Flp pilus assembly protein CpaB [bacterium]|nr:Flp pilus assembly protein CpaB [bacterium]
MRNKNLLFLALFIGAIGAFMFLQYQKKQKTDYSNKINAEKARLQEQKKAAEKPVKVIVAKRDLVEGTKITKKDITILEIPKKDKKPDYYVIDKKVIGKTTTTSIYKNEPIRRGRVDSKESAKKLADLIANGNRAMTIKVTKMTAIGGFLKQGDRVDVIATFDKRSVGESLTKIVLQNLKVLASGKKLLFSTPTGEAKKGAKKPVQKKGAKGPGGARIEKAAYVDLVTVEVTPAQAEKLSLIVGSSKLVLVLRSPIDKKIISTEGINPYSLTGLTDYKKIKEMEGKGHAIIFIEEDKTSTKYIKQ